MDGFAKIIAIVFPLNGRNVLSPDFSNALTSAAWSEIFKIVALSKSLMCRKSFCPDFAWTLTEEEGGEVAAAEEEIWQAILDRKAGELAGEETEMVEQNFPGSWADRQRW